VAQKTGIPKVQEVSKTFNKYVSTVAMVNNTFGYFMTNDWHFVDHNLVHLATKLLDPKERQTLVWDVCDVDFEVYLKNSCDAYAQVISKLKSKL
jgi:hypothetical protein